MAYRKEKKKKHENPLKQGCQVKGPGANVTTFSMFKDPAQLTFIQHKIN